MLGKGNININTTGITNVLLNFLVPIISVAISALMFFVIIYPSINSIPALESNLTNQTQLRDTLKSKKENIYKLVDFKSVVDENSLLVDKAMPSEEKVPALLDQIDTIAKGAGLDVTKLSYTFGEIPADEKEGNYNAVLVSLGAEGSYDQMVTFLKSTEIAARLINIANFRLASLGDAEGKLALNFSIHAPYLMVQSTAVTDDPVTLDITSTDFVNFINRIKEFKYYDYSENVDNSDLPIVPFEETTESTPSEEAATTPQPIPQPTTN